MSNNCEISDIFSNILIWLLCLARIRYCVRKKFSPYTITNGRGLRHLEYVVDFVIAFHYLPNSEPCETLCYSFPPSGTGELI